MTENLLEIPEFLKREPPKKKTRKMVQQAHQNVWLRGVPDKRPTKAQIKVLVKRDWAAQQVMRLSRADAGIIIDLGVGPEARFVKDKKAQFPGKMDDE